MPEQPKSHPQPAGPAVDALELDQLDVVSGGEEVIANRCNQCEANWSNCSGATVS